jgi:hypothetical protein
MTQYARPHAEPFNSSNLQWYSNNGGDTYVEIDEVSADDATSYIETYAPAVSYHADLDTVTDPNGATGTYKVVVRGKMDTDGSMGDGETIRVKLTSGTGSSGSDYGEEEDEESLGNHTAIATFSAVALNHGTWTDHTFNLTSADITRGNTASWANLGVQIYYEDPSYNSNSCFITQVYFQCPDAAAGGGVTTSPAFLLFSGM